jgi:hypothetical protein
MIQLLLFIPIAAAIVDSTGALPTADEVVVKMVVRDNERQAALYGYAGVRRYVLDNEQRHKRAEMLVHATCTKDGSKQFETISENGWGGARKHVFSRLLQAETEASRPGVRDRSRVLPENYTFEMVGLHPVDGRPAYEIKVEPKSANQYLMRGHIWIDAEEYAIVRMEGEPAKNPSFWIKSVHFVRTYGKHGSFWLPASNYSVTNVRIFGSTRLDIDYFDYSLNPITISSNVTPARHE